MFRRPIRLLYDARCNKYKEHKIISLFVQLRYTCIMFRRPIRLLYDARCNKYKEHKIVLFLFT